MYKVKRNGIAHNGTVVLETQADVDAFGQRGITLIDGNLTIGRVAGMDSITSLAPLAGLKEVAYSLTVNPTFSGAGLGGLETLEHVGGTFQAGGTTTATGLKHIETLSLPALKTTGAISLLNTVTFIVELPELTTVNRQLSLNCPLYQLQLPSLQYAGGTVTVSGSSATIAQISLPALEEAGSIAISSLSNATKIDLPQLKKAGALSCSSMAKLSFIYAPLLEEVTGRITLSSLAGLPEFELPELKQAGEVYISSCAALRMLEFPKLIRTNSIYLYMAPVDGLAGFPALQSAGSITLYDMKTAVKIEVPAATQKIDYMEVYITSSGQEPSEINVKGTEIGTLYLRQHAVKTGKLIGDEVFHGTLRFNIDSSYPDSFPLLDGFSEVDSVYLESGSLQEVHVRSIRKVNKGMYMGTGYSGYPRNFSLPDLEEVGGDLRIGYPYMTNSAATFTAITLNKLKRVGGDFTFDVSTASVETLNFPELTEIGGNFTLTSSYDATYSTYGFRGFGILNFPQLTAIGGKLIIKSGSSSYNNTKLTNLAGFATLASVQAIEVTRQAALTDFTGLQNAFNSLASPSDWSVANNSYNPTYQDLKDGKWTK
jgi:hypothetical protein